MLSLTLSMEDTSRLPGGYQEDTRRIKGGYPPGEEDTRWIKGGEDTKRMSSC